MNYKYVIIFLHEDSTVWKVYKIPNKRILRDRLTYEIERYPALLVADKNAFEYSDEILLKRARKCSLIYEIDQ